MKVVLFAGAALVTGVAMFGAVRASQEATPVVVAETKRVIRQVTQTELVEQLKAEVASLTKRVDDAETFKHGLMASSEKLFDQLESAKAKLAKRDAEVDILHRKLADAERALARMVTEAAELRSALASK
jgi:chromosome segregation ATPase